MLNKWLRSNQSKMVALMMGLGLISAIIPLRIAVTRYQAPKPEAILVLGGSTQRIHLAAEFSENYPNLNVWVSDFAQQFPVNQQIFQEVGVSTERVYYDKCAVDTITNFTCTLKDFKKRNIRHVYLVTSDYHIERSVVIATLIFGSEGIIVTPISLPSEERSEESTIKTVRDGIRSLIWIVTRRSGASLKPTIDAISSKLY